MFWGLGFWGVLGSRGLGVQGLGVWGFGVLVFRVSDSGRVRDNPHPRILNPPPLNIRRSHHSMYLCRYLQYNMYMYVYFPGTFCIQGKKRACIKRFLAQALESLA